MQISAVTSGSTVPDTQPSAASTMDPLADKQVFLNLLVAQIKNQNPLNPTDSTQFVTQLAQFSQLEQIAGIRDTVNQLLSIANTTATAGAEPPETNT